MRSDGYYEGCTICQPRDTCTDTPAMVSDRICSSFQVCFLKPILDEENNTCYEPPVYIVSGSIFDALSVGIPAI